MKIKITTITLLLSLCASLSAHAKEDKKAAKFAAHKAVVIKDLTKRKSIIETAISCFSSASNRDGMKKCRAQKKASMKAWTAEKKVLQTKREAEKKTRKEERKRKREEKKASSAN